MSLQQAQLWLQNHSDSIPAINFNHQKIINLVEQKNKSLDIIGIAAADPGLSLTLLKKVNASRGAKSGRDSVTSTKSAIALLGDKVSQELLTELTVAETEINNPQQLFLFKQIINRSYHNEFQVDKWAQRNGYQNIEQLKSAALLNYAGEALSCVYDFEHYLQYINAGSLKDEEIKVFDFSFSQLTEALCQQLNLAEIIINSQPHNKSLGQRQKFLLFIATLCHQCEHGWYSQNIQQTFEQFANFLQQPVEFVIANFHQYSVQAARQSILPEAWQAASRLILIQDKAWVPPPLQNQQAVSKPAETAPPPEKTIEKTRTTVTESPKEVLTEATETIQDDIFTRMKKLLKKQNVSQSDILSSAINGLYKEFALSKVSLLLLSKDKQKLQNRMSLGFQKKAPFRNYQVEVSRAGLLKILLNKPQAIWISTSNFKKYEKIIPQSLLASIMTNDFFAMSLFIAEKPIGIIYVDRTDSTEPLDQQTFTQFKQLIALTSKALTYLAKK